MPSSTIDQRVQPYSESSLHMSRMVGSGRLPHSSVGSRLKSWKCFSRSIHFVAYRTRYGRSMITTCYLVSDRHMGWSDEDIYRTLRPRAWHKSRESSNGAGLTEGGLQGLRRTSLDDRWGAAPVKEEEEENGDGEEEVGPVLPAEHCKDVRER